MSNHYSNRTNPRAAPERRSPPGGGRSVRFEAQRPAFLFAPKGEETLASQQRDVFDVLRQHPDQWLRPNNEARLLACLTLALEGWATAVEDEEGLRFRLNPPVVSGSRTHPKSMTAAQRCDTTRRDESRRVPC